ncbi:MAG: ABC transporter substrate-binding protein [Proteobacteria bacterium]|nr:ABC transporter substrate-binding protein [Pseudomonadota bacterium]MBI3497851.1 ABC transporter substrate-binding protein [Pseudomonadota bacterium]
MLASSWKRTLWAALPLLGMGLGGLASGGAAAAEPKTLILVPHADLKFLDPLAAAATITIMHSTNIYDSLFGWDPTLAPKPQMVESYTISGDKLTYTFTLRPGLKFHTGEAVTTKDVIKSLDRWMKRDLIGRKLAEFTQEMKPVDDKTFTIRLKEAYSWVEYSLGNHAGNFPAIMREKEASTDPFTVLTESIGSGPYKFAKDEWQPGSKVVYLKNTDYVPRSDPPNGMAGAKIVKVDRLEYKIITDQQTQMQAIIRGEVDMLDMFSGDLIPLLQKQPDIVVAKVPPVANFGFIRPNALQPPFNNIKARQALALVVDQKEFLQVFAGPDPSWGKPCYAFYLCGATYGTELGSEAYQKRDIEKAKRLFKEAGYNGEKVVVLNSTEVPQIGAIMLATAAALKLAGVNAELETTDWGTMLTKALQNKKPVAEGGWSVWGATGSWSTWHNPLTNLGTNMATDASAWGGWAADEEVEKLRNEFIRAPDMPTRLKVAEVLHKRLWDVVPYVPTGMFDSPYAWRKNISGVLPTSKLVLWNIAKD